MTTMCGSRWPMDCVAEVGRSMGRVMREYVGRDAVRNTDQPLSQDGSVSRTRLDPFHGQILTGLRISMSGIHPRRPELPKII